MSTKVFIQIKVRCVNIFWEHLKFCKHNKNDIVQKSFKSTLQTLQIQIGEEYFNEL